VRNDCVKHQCSPKYAKRLNLADAKNIWKYFAIFEKIFLVDVEVNNM